MTLSKPLRPSLSKEEIERLCKRRDGISLLAVVLIFSGTAASVVLAVRTYSLLTVLPWILVIGGFQHALSIVQHEANHLLLFSNKFLNEVVGRLSATSVGFTMNYREVHLRHHRHLGDDDDPDLFNYVNYPSELSYLVKDFFKHLFGLAAATQFVDLVFRSKKAAPRGQPPFNGALEFLGLAFTQAVIFSAFLIAGKGIFYLLLWIIPLVTVTKTLTHFRNVVEHARLRETGDPELSRYRTIRANLLELFLFSPLNFNFHAEHHFYPSLPFYNLPEAHRLLSSQAAYKNTVDVQTDGYLLFLVRRTLRSK